MHRMHVFASVEDDQIAGRAAFQPPCGGGIVTEGDGSVQHRGHIAQCSIGIHVRPPYIATVGAPCLSHATRHGGFSNACQAGQSSGLVLLEQALDGRHV